MQNLRNSVRLIGRLGNDPEVKEFSEGKKLARISIATSDSYTDADGNKVEDTQWHNVVAWGKQADLVENLLKKGQEVAIEGKLVSKSYTDKEGVKRYQTEIVMKEMLLFSKANSTSSSENA